MAVLKSKPYVHSFKHFISEFLLQGGWQYKFSLTKNTGNKSGGATFRRDEPNENAPPDLLFLVKLNLYCHLSSNVYFPSY